MEIHREDLQDSIRDWLIDTLSGQLGLCEDQIETDQPFSYFGLGSAETVMIVGDLEAWLDCSFPSSIAFDYPDIDSLSVHLATDLGKYANAASV